MTPLWRGQLRVARQRGQRIAQEARAKEEEFQQRRDRVVTATARAERAAVLLLQRHEDLARTVARYH